MILVYFPLFIHNVVFCYKYLSLFFEESPCCLDHECEAWEAAGCNVCWTGMFYLHLIELVFYTSANHLELGLLVRLSHSFPSSRQALLRTAKLLHTYC
jgi:hypothetical protein